MTEPPPPKVEPARRALLDRVSVVWLVPLAALIISLAVAWQNYASRGPLVYIAFDDAAGISPGETELRYREVPVGLVEDVGFTDDLASVLVTVRVDQDVAAYVDDSAEFWVVSPQVTAQGVTGLSTVLSGVFIEGSWDTEIGTDQTVFTGRQTPPVARADQAGLQIVLSSLSGDGLLEGTPIIYRGVQVGAVANLRLAEDGEAVLADAFVEAPHDQLISTATRFWDASGFSFTLGPQGATLDVTTLAALVSGGIEFENLVTGGEDVEPGVLFELFGSRDEALASVFLAQEDAERVRVGAIFSGDVSGLSAGAAVEFAGIRVGEVESVTGYIDEERFGDRRVRLLATLEIRPGRLGLEEESTQEEVYAFLEELVDRGLRATLARGSLLVGGLKVELEEFEDVPTADIDLDADPNPIFPSLITELPETAATAEALIARVNNLPIEEVLQGVTEVLSNVNAVLESEALRETPDAVLALLDDVRGVVGSDEVQALPGQVGEILQTLETATGDLGDLLAQLEEAGVATALTEGLTTAAAAIATLDRVLQAAEPAAAELPALVERVGGLADDLASVARTASGLPLDRLVGAATETVEAVRALVAGDAAQSVPQALAEALDSLRSLLADVAEAGLVATANAALTEAADAAAAIEEATALLPGLVAEAERFATAAAEAAENVAGLPLEPLLAEATETAAAARALLASEELQSVPAEAAAALAELQATLAQVQETNLVATADSALAGAADAAAAVEAALADLPALVDQLEVLAASATTVTDQLATLRIDLLLAEATDLVQSAQALIGSPAAQRVPEEAAAVLAEVNAVLDEVREAGLVTQASGAAASAAEAAEALAIASADLPGLIDRIEGVAAEVEALPLAELVGSAEGALASADALLDSPSVRSLPAELNSALSQLRSVLVDLSDAGFVTQATEALAGAEAAAAAVEEATAGVPDLVTGLTGLADTANALPLERLATDLAGLAAAAEELLSAEGAEELPAALTATLSEVQLALAELREGGLIASANETLGSTRDAAAAVAEASASLPQLAARLDALADQAQTTLRGYDEGSQLTREAQATLREVQQAARAISALARTIERDPNSLLLGR